MQRWGLWLSDRSRCRFGTVQHVVMIQQIDCMQSGAPSVCYSVLWSICTHQPMLPESLPLPLTISVPLCPPGVSAVVVTSDRHVILLQRSGHVSEGQGLFDVPGGHPEPSHLGVQTLAGDGGMPPQLTPEAVCREIFDSATAEVGQSQTYVAAATRCMHTRCQCDCLCWMRPMEHCLTPSLHTNPTPYSVLCLLHVLTGV
jgi:hypothetical protein